MKVIGFRRSSFKGKDGTDVSGVNLYLTEPNTNGEGLACDRILRHEVLLMLLEVAHHFRAERQLPAACPVDGHCLRPHLL